MNTRQKGRAFALKIIERFRQDVDKATYEVVGSGAGKDKGDVRVPRFDLVIEAKDDKKAAVASWANQAERQGLGYSKTALIWRHPKSPSSNPEMRVDISIDYFIELLLRSGEPVIKKEDRDFRYKVERLKSAAGEVLKEL